MRSKRQIAICARNANPRRNSRSGASSARGIAARGAKIRRATEGTHASQWGLASRGSGAHASHTGQRPGGGHLTAFRWRSRGPAPCCSAGCSRSPRSPAPTASFASSGVMTGPWIAPRSGARWSRVPAARGRPRVARDPARRRRRRPDRRGTDRPATRRLVSRPADRGREPPHRVAQGRHGGAAGSIRGSVRPGSAADRAAAPGRRDTCGRASGPVAPAHAVVGRRDAACAGRPAGARRERLAADQLTHGQSDGLRHRTDRRPRRSRSRASDGADDLGGHPLSDLDARPARRWRPADRGDGLSPRLP
jgi:hypothetical protein